MYITLMGGVGLRQATKIAILNANYIAAVLQPHYPVLYRGGHGQCGRVAHECILDIRAIKAHTGVAEKWDRPYTRAQAAFPLPWVAEHKFWPSVNRIDDVYGDRNLQCSCPTMEEYSA